MLQYAIDTARSVDGIDRVVVALGHAAEEIEVAVDTSGCEVVVTDRSAGGCSGSITAGIAALDGGAQDSAALDGGAQDSAALDGGAQDSAALDGGAQDSAALDGGAQDSAALDGGAQDRASLDGIILLPGDQPGLTAESIATVLAATGPDTPIAVTRYDDAIGHPFWFAATMFAELRGLGGDKAAWKLVASGRWPVLEVPITGPVPPDVDTWDDYEAIRAELAR